MGEFHSKIAGISHYQKYVYFCRPGAPLILKPEPLNQFDPNAVAVWIMARSLIIFKSEVQLGYLNADIAQEISSHMQQGGHVTAVITEVTGGTKMKPIKGVNILINKY